jgi:predicted RNA-binding protein YlqC (UPF0109 family)
MKKKNTETAKPVGRPAVIGLDRKISRTVSIKESDYERVISHYGSITKAVDFAVKKIPKKK